MSHTYDISVVHISSPDPEPEPILIEGTDGADVLEGNAQDNIIYGYAGDDIIWLCRR